MLRAIAFLIKATLFAVLVLVIGNWARWDGRTLSDQVKHAIAQAERSDITSKVRGWTKNLTDDAREGADSKTKYVKRAPIKAIASDSTDTEAAAPAREDKERIPSSERQKLRNLIRELNHPKD